MILDIPRENIPHRGHPEAKHCTFASVEASQYKYLHSVHLDFGAPYRPCVIMLHSNGHMRGIRHLPHTVGPFEAKEKLWTPQQKSPSNIWRL